ncbi:MAG: trehalose-6-phosphate synthase, partial [Candidatus Acidoferrales bacterium]
ELTQALIVNPYSADHTAEAIHRALTMDDKQVRARMHRLREIVRERNIYKWAEDILRKFRRLG